MSFPTFSPSWDLMGCGDFFLEIFSFLGSGRVEEPTPTFRGSQDRVVSKRVVLADVPGPRNRNEGTKKQNKGTKRPDRGYKKWNDSTKKTGTRAHFPKPPFYKIALLFPLETCPREVLMCKRQPLRLVAHCHLPTYFSFLSLWGGGQHLSQLTEVFNTNLLDLRQPLPTVSRNRMTEGVGLVCKLIQVCTRNSLESK